MDIQWKGLVCGPMVGHVSPTSARLWVLAERRGHVEVRFGPAWSYADRRSAVAADEEFKSLVFDLDGLEPSTQYSYQVFVNGQSTEEQIGSFTTAPEPGRSGVYTFGLASCIKSKGTWRDKRQKAWISYTRKGLDFQLLLGDCVYANSPKKKKLWRSHIHQRNVANYARAVRVIPTYAIWDDHDYFGDNADGFPGQPGMAADKRETLGVYRDVWAMPKPPVQTPEGISNRWSWGDMDFFVLDGRYHRDDRAGEMMGQQQLDWLSRQLESSKAKVKFVGSGSCLTRGRNGWRAYPRERSKFLELLTQYEGVVYLSGDIHECRLPKMPTPAGTVPEIISSGIARMRKPNGKKAGRYVTVRVDTTGESPLVQACLFSRRGLAKETVTVIGSGNPG